MSSGSVKNVEVKHKKDADSNEIQNTFAFVLIDLDERSVRQCIQEFKQETFRGRFLQVTVARENFLEKLKREREEAALLAKTKPDHSAKSAIESTPTAKLPTIKSVKEAPSSSSSSSESEDEQETPKIVAKPNGKRAPKPPSSSEESGESDQDENPLMKKQSKKFVENGKIKIDRSVSGGHAIHVIERNAAKAANKDLNEKSKKADQKRIESMMKMKSSYDEQKLAIKNALAGVDSAKRPKKVVFDDADEPSVAQPAKSSTDSPRPVAREAKKATLFADEDDDDQNENYQNDFAIKEQFQGAKGEKLMRLQTRFQGDKRFAMDATFLDRDSDVDDEEDGKSRRQTTSQKTKKGQIENVSEVDDERKWQYDILESVIGKKLRNEPPPRDPKKR